MSKLAVITGGTKGIGRAIIDKFASQKFDIVTCSRNESDLNLLKKEVESTHSVKVHVFKADLAVRGQAKAFANFVIRLGQSIEVLVNNAGVFTPGQITEEKEGALEAMIESNVYSAYHITRGLVHSMKSKKGGHIFNMCSIASLQAYPNGGSYSISKFALLGFSRVLREELKPFGIRVTAVMPGATLTPSWEGANLPEERLMKSEDVAESVFGAYVLSPRSVVEEIIIRPQLGDL